MTSNREDWPFQGEISFAADKKFEPMVLMVPFFKANKLNLKRHVQFVNELGFDAMVFDLHPFTRNPLGEVISPNGRLGAKAIWSDQITTLCNEIPEKKIIYAFSNPGSAAIRAIAQRKAWDILGLICDSGPASNLWQSMWNYFTTQEPISNPVERFAKASLSSALWSPEFLWDLEKDVKALPEGFPVLSIRGWKDKLIPTQLIDPVFDFNAKLGLQKLALPEASHLNGLKDFPNEYKPAVSRFLHFIATDQKWQHFNHTI